MSEYITPYEMSRRLDGRMHESYIRFLCDQGTIEKHPVPHSDARCRDKYLIPSEEIHVLERILMQNKQVKDLTKEDPKIEKKEPKYLTTTEVCQLTGKSQNTIWYASKTKKLKGKLENHQWLYFEDDVLAYMEADEKKKEEKKSMSKNNASLVPQQNQVDIQKLQNRIKSLEADNENLRRKNDILKKNCDSAEKVLKGQIESLKNSLECSLKNADEMSRKYEELKARNASEKGSFEEGYEQCKNDLAIFLIRVKGKLDA